ncbi:hypothetical protein [Streptomyces sp. NPDC051286]|uniref:hypothetical protein n=1 Tax=Streptomyces sp. NPDC051286 TaxID=3365647 RepID=UPI00379BF861
MPPPAQGGGTPLSYAGGRRVLAAATAGSPPVLAAHGIRRREVPMPVVQELLTERGPAPRYRRARPLPGRYRSLRKRVIRNWSEPVFVPAARGINVAGEAADGTGTGGVTGRARR